MISTKSKTSLVFNNPHSAAQRVKNHLAYKLGLAMMAYDTTTGGGFSKFLLIPKLLFTLKNLKKLHKKQLQIYKEIAPVFPQLKYPDLKTCSDYTDARLVKFHLAYLLGTALMKADKALFQGGYLKLGKDIKKAKQFYKNAQSLKTLFEELNLSKEFLAEVLEQISNSKESNLSFEYFSGQGLILLKETLNLAQSFIYKENPIPNQVQKFILENLQVIHTWLTSNEFKEKYLNKNHPYPPLINPATLNDENQKLNYHTIPAELAWEMNLPLPSGYNFVFLTFGATAHWTIIEFLQSILNLKINVISSLNQKYTHLDLTDTKKDMLVVSRQFLPYQHDDYKIFYLIASMPFIILVRDPISRIKTMVNHGYYTAKAVNLHSFFFKEDPQEVLDRKLYNDENLHYNTKLPNIASVKGVVKISRYMNYAYSSTAEICQKEVYYIDMSEFMPDKIMQSFPKYAKFFNKPLSQEILAKNKEKLQRINFTELSHIIPLTMKIPFKCKILSVLITLIQHVETNFTNLSNELFDENLDILQIVAFAMKEDEFELLKSDKNLFKEVKTYLYQFALELSKVRQEQLNGRKNEKDILEYFKQHKDVALEFKALMDKELVYVKAHRPDIVASWKYYAEFEKICKEFE